MANAQPPASQRRQHALISCAHFGFLRTRLTQFHSQNSKAKQPTLSESESVLHMARKGTYQEESPQTAGNGFTINSLVLWLFDWQTAPASGWAECDRRLPRSLWWIRSVGWTVRGRLCEILWAARARIMQITCLWRAQFQREKATNGCLIGLCGFCLMVLICKFW